MQRRAWFATECQKDEKIDIEYYKFSAKIDGIELIKV